MQYVAIQSSFLDHMRVLPNILTMLRILLIPLLLLSIYLDEFLGHGITAALFLFAMLTDYFDGVIARRYKAHSNFGRMMDPIADKMLIGCTLMMLAWFQSVPLVPALLILSREIIVSGLREYLAEFRISIPVTRLAKVKTACQLFAIFTLIVAGRRDEMLALHYVGEIAMWVAALLTLFTGYAYIKEGFARAYDEYNKV